MAKALFKDLFRAGLALFGALLPGGAAEARACARAEDLAGAPLYRVAAALDGATLELEDGSALRLLHIRAPEGTLGRAAEDALAALTLGKDMRLLPENPPRDRYGQLLAQAFAVQGRAHRWVQGALVRQGLARVETRAESRDCAAELLRLEAKARAGRRGLWAYALYSLRAPDTILPQDVGSFQIVEGRVRDVANVGARTYLNFGPDWRTDFTVTIAARHRKLFPAGALEREALRGRKIRVRGFVEWLNGPMIAATHPEQIEGLPHSKD